MQILTCYLKGDQWVNTKTIIDIERCFYNLLHGMFRVK